MHGKHILITGGTGGLGRFVTKRCLIGGGKLFLTYRSENDKNKFRAELSSGDQDQITFIKADLADADSVKQFYSQLAKIEVLLHLAGGFAMGAIERFPLEDWQRQLNLNLTTSFLVIRYALPLMQKINYGRIVTIASRTAVEPAAQMAAYAAAKAGVVALTKSVAEETKGTGITANVVLPGIIDTPANRKAMGTDNQSKWVAPEALAEIIFFLGSEKAGDIRGATIPVYGNL